MFDTASANAPCALPVEKLHFSRAAFSCGPALLSVALWFQIVFCAYAVKMPSVRKKLKETYVRLVKTVVPYG